MRQMCVWFLLSCKRHLKRPSFVLILLLLPLLCGFLHSRQAEESQQVRVAVCALTEDPGPDGAGLEDLGAALVNELTESQQEDSIFQFYLCEDETAVREDVASRQAECGYVVEADLRGRLERDEAERSIRVYCAPSTVLDGLADEVVSAALARLYDREIFINYIDEKGHADGRVDPGEVYDKWLDGGATFHFEYRYLDSGAGAGQTEQPTEDLFPIRGIAAVMLFLIGVYSMVILGLDEEKGVFLSLVARERYTCRLAAATAPVALAAVSCLAALWAGGCITHWGKEILVMLVYILAVTAYGLLLKAILRSPRLIGCLIPLLLVASFIFCPVFLDIGRYFPALRAAGMLLPPWYYLRAF